MRTPHIVIRQVGVAKVLDLRHKVLRAGLPIEAAHFEGDQAQTTLHLAAFQTNASGHPGENPVACLSLMLNSFNGQPAWQLRGMAVEPSLQRHGLGSRLLAHAEQAAAADGSVGLLWCNARLGATGFYQKMGWSIVSSEFNIPTAGPHVNMIKKLARLKLPETVDKRGGCG
jgi:GNAT superfamily N-acetyltransferase